MKCRQSDEASSNYRSYSDEVVEIKRFVAVGLDLQSLSIPRSRMAAGSTGSVHTFVLPRRTSIKGCHCRLSGNFCPPKERQSPARAFSQNVSCAFLIVRAVS